MFDPKNLEELSKRLTDALPPGISHMRDDIEKNVQALLQSSLSRLNLVSREEFDVQSGVLARTRAKLEELEEQVTSLEKMLRQDEED